MKKRFLFAGTAAFALLTSFCLLLLIPYIGDAVLPSLLQKLPFEGKNIQISRVTPWKIVGHFNITDKKSKFSSARFEAHYSPSKIYKGAIDTIILNGALIELAPELFTSKTKSQTKVDGNSNIFDGLPIVAEKIILNDMTIITRFQDNLAQTLHIDGAVTLSTTRDGEKYNLNQLHAELTTTGSLHSKISSTLEIHTNSHLLKTDIVIKKLDLPESLNPLPFSGKVHSNSTIRFNKMFSKVLNIDADATSPDLHLPLDQITVAAQQNIPLQFKFNGTTEILSYAFKGVEINSPYTTIKTSGKGEFYPENYDLTSQVTLTLPEFNEPLKATVMKTGDKFNFELHGEKLQTNDLQLQHAPLNLQLSGTIVNNQIQAHLEAKINNLTLPKQGIKIAGIKLSQPLKLVNNQLQQTTGAFTINDIFYQQERLATVSGTTKVSDSSQSFTAKIKSPMHTKMAIKCNGSYQPSKETSFLADCNLNDIIFSQHNLPRFVKVPDDLTFNTQLGADLKLTFDKSMQATLQTRVKNTTINSGEKLSLTGLSTQIDLPYLPMQNSLPSQKLHIDEINIGAIQLTDADIAYRLEDFKTLFIEQSKFNWCGGKVESGSIRLASDKDEYSLTLYCDRIGFTELLGQLGMPNAEGDGTLNGRLPISLTGSTLHFDDGFLFSSPGDSGIVRFTNTEVIRDNLGANVGASYLDYSMSSLENFKYNWATLSFNSIDDNLTISMQLDGKPAEPLPFTYKNGQLVPSDTGVGIQHPIHLDVNFHLPLTDLLYYGRNIQSLMETM